MLKLRYFLKKFTDHWHSEVMLNHIVLNIEKMYKTKLIFKKYYP